MTHKSLLDEEPNQPDDDSSIPEKQPAIMNELSTAVEVIKSNYATKEELAIISGKLDVISSNQQAFQSHAIQTFATKAELSNAVYQLTWRMAGFTALLLSAGFAFARYFHA
ncbi:hypothetical protein GTP46_19590 [Duganella sp. FT135W]|uniref:DUF1640 domain-containing protein n=1 Tax=Duganella flavida TaxID=2692175 RepID=A0A6L8KJY0_9BURK|nr:hypothetical protein [Duganella flavida]MYM24841.1 hypothetical protein [Duganella flavida]